MTPIFHEQKQHSGDVSMQAGGTSDYSTYMAFPHKKQNSIDQTSLTEPEGFVMSQSSVMEAQRPGMPDAQNYRKLGDVHKGGTFSRFHKGSFGNFLAPPVSAKEENNVNEVEEQLKIFTSSYQSYSMD